MERVLIKKLVNSAKIPTRGSNGSAGYDLYAVVDGDFIQINPHTTVTIGTGIALAIPEGYYGDIYPRSGLATREGLRLANCVGVIDQDYRGEIKIAIHSDANTTRFIMPGERIAQIVFKKYEPVNFEEVLQLPTTSRGEGGFGSTGKK